MKIITGRHRWVLTEESPRLTTMDDKNTLAVFAGYYTRSLFPLPAFLNDVAGIHPGLIKLNEIKTPVLEFFLTCIERDSLCYNIFVSSQEFFCPKRFIRVSTLPGNDIYPTRVELRVLRVGNCFLTVWHCVMSDCCLVEGLNVLIWLSLRFRRERQIYLCLFAFGIERAVVV